jgi:hypothetical protein
VREVKKQAPFVDNEARVVKAFLGLLEKDSRTRFGRGSDLSKESLARAVRLTKNVKVTGDEEIPESVTL